MTIRDMTCTVQPVDGGGPMASCGLCGASFARISAFMPREQFEAALDERQQHAKSHRGHVAPIELFEQLDRLRLLWTARWLADHYPNMSVQHVLRSDFDRIWREAPPWFAPDDDELAARVSVEAQRRYRPRDDPMRRN